MKVCCKFEKVDGGVFLHYPDKATGQKMNDILTGCEEKYNGYVNIEIQKPYKARTNQQNRMFWGIVQQIANEIGDDIESVENDLKMKAIAKGYPYKVSKITGQPVPYSMTKVNTVEQGYLIDTAIETASFLGIVIDEQSAN
ncbi:MAG: hypothetical protein MJ179_02465 [Treponema sp.]|nr:hypothetical protein [Treponema sp.]